MPPNWVGPNHKLPGLSSPKSIPSPDSKSFKPRVVGLTGIAVTLSGVEKGKKYVLSIPEPSWPVSYPRCLFSLREYNCEWEFRSLRGRMKDYSSKWIPHVLWTQPWTSSPEPFEEFTIPLKTLALEVLPWLWGPVTGNSWSSENYW